MKSYEIVIIGGGPAGLAAALAAKESGVGSILILERDRELGGILNQCIHNGFGLHTFKEELTGPEYAYRFIEKVLEQKIEYKLNTMVMDITQSKIVTYMNRTEGMVHIQAKAIILAMGCRERPRGALNIPGFRPAGIFSAGTAQRLVNMEGYMPGREVVILGSGDIGLIMARRMTLEGAHVKVVAEIMPYSGGLKRNIVQCLDDFGIPLRLSHTIVDIRGVERVEGVTIAQVDEHMKPVPGTEEDYDCDTILLSVGLIPENELSNKINVQMNAVTSGPVVNESLETNVEGVFACGNVLHVHDLVDYVSEEAALAGKNAAKYVLGKFSGQENSAHTITLEAVDGVRYTVPKTVNIGRMEDTVKVRFRVGNVFKDSYVSVYYDDERVLHRKKIIMAPGEMEDITLDRKKLLGYPDLKKITVKIEKE
ncbi:NAD(P)/FAD-dependent oxidoreductase [Caproiciproducens sp. CPB-2]|uniref:NAD(P)/FAD-dependent oxidoreductase n=1 Tax=Caproiciproducens sp. CPB-2 TaxID=3030017 RepID=UPI002E34DE52|nr:FAD-dependent oxidoreductase [Caproiciproducens sp. CPB-2]